MLVEGQLELTHSHGPSVARAAGKRTRPSTTFQKARKFQSFASVTPLPYFATRLQNRFAFCPHFMPLSVIKIQLQIGILESSLVRFFAPSFSPALANKGLFELTFIDTGHLVFIHGKGNR